MVNIPFFGNIGGKPQQPQQQQQQLDPIRIAHNIPLQQAGMPPTIEVVREVSATEYIDEAWRKKYKGFDLKQIGYSNFTLEEVKTLRGEFEVFQDRRINFELRDKVFDNEENETLLDNPQYAQVIQNQGRKGIGSGLANKVLSATSINKTEVQAGIMQRPSETQRGGVGNLLRI